MTRTTNRSYVRLLAQTVAVLCLLVLVVGAARAQDHDDSRPQTHFSGLINDYGPTSVSGGPYEMRGPWSLELHPGAASADFTLYLNMETSDYGMAAATLLNPKTPLPDRGAHTHLISLHGAISTDTSHCPAYNPAPTAGPVIVVMGQPQIITGNGGTAPFQLKGLSTLWICLAGNTVIPFSNIAITFSDGPATTHFGTQPIHGAVIPESLHDDHDHDH